MIQNIFQNIEQVISAAAPDERIMWQQIRLITGENAAIQQYYFAGTFTGTELLTYSASRLFYILKGVFSTVPAGLIAPSNGNITLFDAKNTQSFCYTNKYPAWDVVGAAFNYSYNPIEIKNSVFSRFTDSGGLYTLAHLIGFKITY